MWDNGDRFKFAVVRDRTGLPDYFGSTYINPTSGTTSRLATLSVASASASIADTNGSARPGCT